MVKTTAEGAHHASTAVAEVNSAVNQMDQVVQQNAAMVEESTAATHSMKAETRELIQLIGKFQVSGAPSSGVSNRDTGPRLVSEESMARPSPAPLRPSGTPEIMDVQAGTRL